MNLKQALIAILGFLACLLGIVGIVFADALAVSREDAGWVLALGSVWLGVQVATTAAVKRG